MVFPAAETLGLRTRCGELMGWLGLGSIALLGLLWPMISPVYLLGGDLGQDIRGMASGDLWKRASLSSGATLAEIVRSYRVDALLMGIGLYQLLFVFLVWPQRARGGWFLASATWATVAASFAFSQMQVLQITATHEKLYMLGALVAAMVLHRAEKRPGTHPRMQAVAISLAAFILGFGFLAWSEKAGHFFYLIYVCSWLMENSRSRRQTTLIRLAAILPVFLSWMLATDFPPQFSLENFYLQACLLAALGFYLVERWNTAERKSGLIYGILFLLSLKLFANDLALTAAVLAALVVTQGESLGMGQSWRRLAAILSLGITGLMLGQNLQAIQKFAGQSGAFINYLEDFLGRPGGGGLRPFRISKNSLTERRKTFAASQTSLANLILLSQGSGSPSLQIRETKDFFEIISPGKLRMGDVPHPICLDPFVGVAPWPVSPPATADRIVVEASQQNMEVSLFQVPLLRVKIQSKAARDSLVQYICLVQNQKWLNPFFPVHSTLQSSFAYKQRQTLHYLEQRNEPIYKLHREMTYDPSENLIVLQDHISTERSRSFPPKTLPFQDPLSLIRQIGSDLKHGVLQSLYAFIETRDVKLLAVEKIELGRAFGHAQTYGIRLRPVMNNLQSPQGDRISLVSDKAFDLYFSREEKQLLGMRIFFGPVPFRVAAEK